MIAEHKGEIPVVILLLPFIAGISLGLCFPGANALIVTALLSLVSFAFISLGLLYNPLGLYKVQWIGGILVFPLLLMAGWLSVIQHSDLNEANHFSKKPARYLLARVSSEPRVKDDLIKFTAEIVQANSGVETTPVTGNMLVTIKDELARNLFYGEDLLIPAKFNTVEPPYNPGEFNYKQYLAHKNIYHQAFLYPKQYKVLSVGNGNPLIAYALEVRQNLVKKLKANMHDTTAIAVASTLILGYKADLSNDVLQAYSKTGTIHILSVSGGHVAILYLLLMWVLHFGHISRGGRIIKALIIVIIIWIYALLTGFSPAANRAALMISMVICGKTFYRYVNTLNILACSAFGLLLIDPFLLVDVGFQLSYLAVAGLIVFQPIICQWFTFKHKAVNYLWQACSVSIAAQVITFPLSAYYFHQFPIYFLVSNLILIVPVTIIMYVGLLLLALPQIDYISNALGYVLEQSILLMNKALVIIEHAPYAVIDKIWITRFEYLLLYFIIISIFYWLFSKKKRPLWLAFISAIPFCVSISLKKVSADSTKSVTFLNLRKHTGVVFKNGNKGVVLTDLADTDKYFAYAIQPCLDSMKITDYQVYGPKENIQNLYLLKRQQLVQFLDKRLMLLNQEAPPQSIPQRLEIQYFYVSNNADISSKDTGGRMVILDGSNSDSFIDQFKNIPVNCRILKRNKSITITSN